MQILSTGLWKNSFGFLNFGDFRIAEKKYGLVLAFGLGALGI